MNTLNILYNVHTIKFNVPYYIHPLQTFYNICGKKKSTLLLESSEISNKNQLKSMIIIDTAIRITAYKRTVVFDALSKNGKNILDKIQIIIPKIVNVNYVNNKMKLVFPSYDSNLDEDSKLLSLSIFDCFRFIIRLFRLNYKELYELFFGGLFSYDLVSNFEHLPKVDNVQNCPDFCFYLSEVLMIIDHLKKKSIIQGSVFFDDEIEKCRITKRLLNLKKQLNNCCIKIPNTRIDGVPMKVNFNDMQYQKIVKDLQMCIKKGEIFQVVPSRRFFLSCPYPLKAYDLLKFNNPSPYMFFMQDINFTLFGASPESSLKYNPINRTIEIYPIAGTRSRGFDKNGNIDLDLDSKIELEMRTNQKELSEHLMLVDLARNDLSRICIPGTRFVSQLTHVDRYSHVMHLVSKVVGILKNNLDALHAYSSCMNMGTLTGAPKVRAMELIYQTEKITRGSYGGSIGYFTGSGVLDTCIIIRSAYVENDIAIVQAGAGVVLDSIPIEEVYESRKKAQVVLDSIIQSNYKKRIDCDS
ncbi:anthranilate synthase component 1 [Buchnera aphidicola]|uniref:anthranilate synthase component 1 n=1 Tax=Buchnera aphidicola TaxID=9 RepID=UPI0034647A4F